MPRVPQLSRQKSSGQFFVHWAGKRRYLGTDRVKAEARYLTQLDEWKQWRDGFAVVKAMVPRASRTVTVGEIIDEFLSVKRIERGYGCEQYYEYALREFRHEFEEMAASLFRAFSLEDFKHDLIGKKKYSPKTINHQLTAVRVLFNWACAVERIPPVTLRAVKNLPLGPAMPKFLSREKIGDVVRSAPPQLACWIATQYLTLMRPSEMVKVAHGLGEWVEVGVFVLHRGKTDERSPIRRHIVCSDEALKWLAKCKPTYSSLVTYSQASRKYAEIAPSILRKSAARHLAESGVRRDDVEVLLGHYGARLAVTYFEPVFQRLRKIVAKLKV